MLFVIIILCCIFRIFVLDILDKHISYHSLHCLNSDLTKKYSFVIQVQKIVSRVNVYVEKVVRETAGYIKHV